MDTKSRKSKLPLIRLFAVLLLAGCTQRKTPKPQRDQEVSFQASGEHKLTKVKSREPQKSCAATANRTKRWRKKAQPTSAKALPVGKGNSIDISVPAKPLEVQLTVKTDGQTATAAPTLPAMPVAMPTKKIEVMPVQVAVSTPTAVSVTPAAEASATDTAATA